MYLNFPLSAHDSASPHSHNISYSLLVGTATSPLKQSWKVPKAITLSRSLQTLQCAIVSSREDSCKIVEGDKTKERFQRLSHN